MLDLESETFEEPEFVVVRFDLHARPGFVWAEVKLSAKSRIGITCNFLMPLPMRLRPAESFEQLRQRSVEAARSVIDQQGLRRLLEGIEAPTPA